MVLTNSFLSDFFMRRFFLRIFFFLLLILRIPETYWFFCEIRLYFLTIKKSTTVLVNLFPMAGIHFILWEYITWQHLVLSGLMNYLVGSCICEVKKGGKKYTFANQEIRPIIIINQTAIFNNLLLVLNQKLDYIRHKTQ